jgi:hypothetical protein
VRAGGYGGDVAQRTAARRVAISLHVPSNLYATRGEALAIVPGFRAGTIRTQP